MSFNQYKCEIEVAEGLEKIAISELTGRYDKQEIRQLELAPGAVRFLYSGKLRHLSGLKTAIAVYIVLDYDVPRPRALLGHEHFQRLINTIMLVVGLSGHESFNTFRLSSAGSDSSVMLRIKQEIVSHTGLQHDDATGDLFLRIRKARRFWQVLVRLTPRPLATRKWRVCDMEGALNASVAHAMTLLTTPRQSDMVLNLACGSGTLLIERLIHDKVRQAIGCDNDVTALSLASSNINAAHFQNTIKLVLADICRLPFASDCFDVLLADLPFGQLVGSHEENLKLYPGVLKEAARVAQKDACFALVTHEIRLMERLIITSPDWTLDQMLKITLSGLHPRIFLLRKS